MPIQHTDDERAARRVTFDQVAQRYDEIRPGYPAALIEDIIAISALPPQARILEIGCGTGQATLPFAERGYGITCVELGPEMAALAAANCRPYPAVQVVNAAFEEWVPDTTHFDLVMSATAWHWVPPEIGYPKAAQLLRSSGYLAIFTNVHPKPLTDFFAESQAVYRAVVPEWGDPNNGPTTKADIEAKRTSIDSLGLFEPVTVRTYPWTHTYTTSEYLDLLNTYSDHLNLEESKRRQLHDGLAAMIDNRYGGVVTKPYLSVLYIARKKML